MKKIVILGLALVLGSVAQATIVDFEGFRIRNHNGTITAPWDANLSIVENAAGDGFSAMTPESGQKVGYGTNAFNNCQLNTVGTVTWDKVAGDVNISYLNIWVTDGSNYAIISSENEYRGTNFGTRNEWKIFEFGGPAGNLNWLFDAGVGSVASQYLQLDGANATLNDISDNVYIYSGPGVGAPGVGTGAPQGGFGFNLIYGDTQANFIGAYHLENLEVTVKGVVYEAGAPVPEPATISLLLMGLGGLVASQRRKRS